MMCCLKIKLKEKSLTVFYFIYHAGCIIIAFLSKKNNLHAIL
jgi:hypothetical protein